MTQEFENQKDVLKFSFTWVIIMLTVNLFYAGYTITSTDADQALDEVTLFALYFSEQSTSLTNLNAINETNHKDGFTVEEVNKPSGSISGYIIDALDGIFQFVKPIAFVVSFIAMGGWFLTWDILTDGIVNNVWIKMFISAFMFIGNTIFFILLYKLVIRKGQP